MGEPFFSATVRTKMNEERSAVARSQKERRLRRQHNKTRSGCITCRRRHVKCDEGKPCCNRCSNARRRCEGYDTPVPWIFEPESAKPTLVFQTTNNAWGGPTPHRKTEASLQDCPRPLDRKCTQYMPASSLYPLARSLSLDVDWTERERQLFWLYLQLSHSIIEAVDDADVELFCTLVPQTSIYFPAIRAAVLCFASYIGSLIDPNNAREGQLSAEWQYRKVLKSAASARSPSPNSRWAEIFLVSLLLRCLETYRNDYSRAVTHLQGAIGIIRGCKSSSAAQSLDACVQNIINRVKAKMNSRSKIMSHSPMSPFAQFNSVVDGICEEFNGSGGAGLRGPERLNLIRKCINRLDSCFPNLDTNRLSTSQKPSYIYLHIQYQICRLVLCNLEDLRALSQVESHLALQNILDLCSRFNTLNLEGTKTISSQGQQVRLGFGIEFISDVLFIATVSGSRQARRSAISLLRSCFRQEWLWDSFQAAQIAEWLIHQEDDSFSPGADLSSSRPVISSANFYQERLESVSSFRRPSWAQLELLWPDRTTKHWLLLERLPLGTQSRTQAEYPADPVLCYNLQGPFWPSTALALTRSYINLLNTSKVQHDDLSRCISEGPLPSPIYAVLGT